MIKPVASLKPTQQSDDAKNLNSSILPGQCRWAIFDRKTRVLYFGPSDVYIHMTVAEYSGVLGNRPEYYQSGGNILGGLLCCSTDGYFYYDPFSGTFPGTNEGVEDAEKALEEICKMQAWKFMKYCDVPRDYLAYR